MPENSLRLAMAQTTSSNCHDDNIAVLSQIASDAAAQGAQMLALPEAVGLMNMDRASALTMIKAADSDPFLAACQQIAQEHNIWIQAGSTPVLGIEEKFLNHATMISPDGTIIASYDKIHLFDVFLSGKKPTGESRRYSAGSEAVTVDTPWGAMALTICYDLRFPHLYRQHAKAGAVVAFVPSAFTVPTGRAHWEVLLRARAIENGMWIVASAQVGLHADGRRTYGHSLIVNPWGEVIQDLKGEVPGIVTVDIDMAEVASARQQIPSLEHERVFSHVHVRTDNTGI